MKKYKKRIWWAFCGFCFGLAPYIFQLADKQRGFNALGGELFIFVIPFLVKLVYDVTKDLFKAIREEANQC